MGVSGGEGGGVQGITAADSTIIIGGTQTAPTVKAHTGTTAGTVAAGDDARFGKIGGVTVTGTPTAGQIPVATGPSAAAWSTPAGGGDVLGPAGATDGHLAVFDGATGKTIKDGGAMPVPATAAPADLAAAAAVGASTKYAREDHAHKMPTASDVGALPDTTAPADIGAVETAHGITVVRHGATAATARPAGADVVMWIGTATPSNAIAHDIWDGN